MQNSAFSRAVVVPAVLVLGLGGALVAGPAFADDATTPTSTAAPTDSTTAPAAPTDPTTAPAAPTDPTTAPAAPSDPTTAPAAPSATATPTASAAPKASSPAPKDLIVTSPAPDDDGDPTPITGPRNVTVTGRAPVGSIITITDDAGRETKTTADANGDWLIALSFADTDSYDQYLEVDGTYRGTDLTSDFVEVLFTAPQSEAPVILTPVTGDTVVGTPEPFVGASDDSGVPVADIVVSGTGTPGDYVEVEGEPTADTADGWYAFGDALVGADGNWTATVAADFSRYSITAYDQKLDSDYNPLTEPSDDSNAVAVIVEKPAGYVAAPDITTPAYPTDDSTSGDGSTYSVTYGDVSAAKARALAQSGDTSGAAVSGSSSGSSVTMRHASEARAFTLPSSTTEAPAALSGSREHTSARPLDTTTGTGTTGDSSATDAAATDAAATDAGDEISPSDIDAEVVDFGIPVKGVADAAGDVPTTVSGTGTPGDHIVLYSAKASTAYDYFTKLYPDYFAEFGGTSGDATVPSAPIAPTATVPADPGTITVGADGTWTTSVPLATGPNYLTAFAVDAAGTYSVAGTVLPLEVTATAATATTTTAAASAPATLAFTGSDDRGALAMALGALASGVALVVTARRRRRLRADD